MSGMIPAFTYDSKERRVSLAGTNLLLECLSPELLLEDRRLSMEDAREVFSYGSILNIMFDGLRLELHADEQDGFTLARAVLRNEGNSDLRLRNISPLALDLDWSAGGIARVTNKARIHTFPAERFYGYDTPRSVSDNRPAVSCWAFACHDAFADAGFLAGIDDAPAGFVRFRITPLQSDLHGFRVLRWRCDIDCLSGARGVRIPPGSSFDAGSVAIHAWRGTAAGGLNAYAERLGRHTAGRSIQQAPNGWCSWYAGYADDINETACIANLRAAAGLPGMEYFQIDDGWTAGRGIRTDSDIAVDKVKFPSGMKDLARRIKESGLVPGIWLRPFQGWGLGEEAPEWARGVCVDPSNPACLAWLSEKIRVITEDWGYRYLKLDFLTWDFYGVWGMDLLGPKPARFVPADDTRSNIQIYRDALSALREAAGADCFILGCNCLSAPALGMVDGMRIGDDVSANNWERTVVMGARAVAPSLHLHTRAWVNDADCMLFHKPLSIEQIWTWNAFISLTGHSGIVGSPLDTLDGRRLSVAARLLPVISCDPADLQITEQEHVTLVLRKVRGRSELYHVAGMFNWSAEFRRVGRPALLSVFPPETIVFEFIKSHACTLREFENIEVPPYSCVLLRISSALEHPWLWGCVGHLLQGAADLGAYAWDNDANVLSIQSAQDRDNTVVLHIPDGYEPAVSSPARNHAEPDSLRVPLQAGGRTHRLHFFRKIIS